MFACKNGSIIDGLYYKEILFPRHILNKNILVPLYSVEHVSRKSLADSSYGDLVKVRYYSPEEREVVEANLRKLTKELKV